MLVSAKSRPLFPRLSLVLSEVENVEIEKLMLHRGCLQLVNVGFFCLLTVCYVLDVKDR